MASNEHPEASNSVTPQRPRIYLARRFPTAVEARIAERYEVVRNPSGDAMGADELAAAARGCEYLFVSATETVSRAVFEALAGPLKGVATLSVGFNHIDLEAARQYGVAVFNSPGVLSDACAEIAMMLILNVARRGHEANLLARSGAWEGWAPTQLLGIGLVGRRMGILGMGRIGQEIARRARGFGIEIHYNNRHRLPSDLELGATYHDTSGGLLRASEIFVLCAPSSPELHRFLNRERIALLPDRAMVINVARGEMVDDDALIEALVSRRLFGAGLDVFDREPKIDPRYAALTNVFVTPHIASATEEARDAMGFILLDGLDAFERGVAAANRLC